ncbi:MAG: PAS domain S-box protein [Chloroflexaceae bacterium]|nr:PAS domain S-box protein [Chloroflexaceae bacterium]
MVTPFPESSSQSDDRSISLFTNNHATILLIDPETGTIEDANPAACAFYGYPHDVLVRMNIADISILTREEIFAEMERAKREQRTHFTFRHRLADGRIRDVDVYSGPIQFQDKCLLYAIIHDTTAQKEAERALQQRQQALQQANAELEQRVTQRTADLELAQFALDHAADSILWLRPDGCIAYANHAASRSLGYSRDELLTRTIYDIDANMDSTEWQQLWLELKQCGHIVLERYQRCRNKNILPVEVTVTYMAVAATEYACAFVRDISERQRTESIMQQYALHLKEMNQELEKRVSARTTEVLQNRKLLQALIDYSPTAIFVNDLEGQYLLINQGGAAVMGITPEQIIGKNRDQLFEHPCVLLWKKEDLQVVESQQPLVVEQSFPQADGLHTYLVTKFPIFDEHDQIYAIGGIMHDITELKWAEESLRKLSRAVEQSPVSVVITDIHGIIEYVNPKFTQVTGYIFEEAIGQNPRILKTDVTPPEIYPQLWDTILAGHEWQGQFYNRKKDRSCYWEEAWISPVTGVDGHISHFVAVKEDITQRKQVEAELQRSKEAAEAANRAKSTFLANMSHELRTPLNAILGFAELIARDPQLLPMHREYLHVIERSGEHLLNLINDILEMARVEAGRITLHEQDTDLHQLLSTLMQMFQLRADEKHIDLILERDPMTPRFVWLDEGKLRQVLINLLSNALKFTMEGQVLLRVAVEAPAYNHHRQDPQGTKGQPYSPRTNQQPRSIRLSFAVQDSGVGIAPHEQDAIFEAFTQASHNQSVDVVEGTGLGLTISQHFIQMMGGHIQVQSTPGEGATFAFTINAGLGSLDALSTTLSDRFVIGVQPEQPDYRILVVEDKPDNRKLLVTILSNAGLSVQGVANGQEAVEAWETWQPHVIFMDLRMPVMDGYEAIRRIKSHSRGKQTIIVALTASVFEEDRIGVMLTGCDHFMRKPFRPEDIFDVLTRYLGLRFVYATPATFSQPVAVTNQSPTFLTELLTALPTEWITTINEATSIGDIEQVEYLIAEIREQHPQLAEQLVPYVNDFRFDVLTNLFEQRLNEAI